MTERRPIHCETHGPSLEAFTCVHIADRGSNLGFVFDPESTRPWPDATCDACAAEREVEDWSEEVALERVRMVCHRCWELAYENNARIERHADPMRFLAKANARAAERQDAWVEKHRINDHAHWEMQLDCESPWLGFGESKTRIHVRADAIVIGSWSSRSNTWLWGWGNSHWDPKLTRDVVAVKRFGERNGIERLWRMGFSADEEDGFELASAAFDQLPALDGIYRVPGAASLFVGLKNTQLVS